MQHIYLLTILTSTYLFVTITIHVSRKMFSRGLGVAVFFFGFFYSLFLFFTIARGIVSWFLCAS